MRSLPPQHVGHIEHLVGQSARLPYSLAIWLSIPGAASRFLYSSSLTVPPISRLVWPIRFGQPELILYSERISWYRNRHSSQNDRQGEYDVLQQHRT